MSVAPTRLRPAVFLDRDGVINRVTLCRGNPRPPASLGDLEILPGVAEALSTLKAQGFALIVVTNQPDVARGTASEASVASIHARLADAAVIVPTVNPLTITPHTEAFQAVIWHLLVSHPLLKAAVMT